MGVYAGLDVSLDAVSICVVGETGEMLWQGKVLGDPGAVRVLLTDGEMILLASVWRPVRRRNGSAGILLTRASPSFAWRAGMSKRR